MTLAFSLQFADKIPFAMGFILAAVGVVILGISKSGFGGGAGIVAVPLFAIAFGAQRGTAILLPLLIATDIFSVCHHWGTWDKNVLRMLTPGTFLGIALGSVALWLMVVGQVAPWNYEGPRSGNVAVTTQANAQRASSAEMLNLLTGIICVAYVLLDQVRQHFAPRWHFKPNHRSGFAAGTAVGVISTLAHAAGPVAAIFLLNQGLPRTVFMGTTVIYFFGINTVKLIPYSIIPGLTKGSDVAIGGLFIIFAPLGTWLGKRLFNSMSEKIFRNMILVITFATGIQLILEYATGIKLAQFIATIFRSGTAFAVWMRL